jgi:adenylate cyclase
MWPWQQIRLLKRALALYAGDHVLEHVLKHGDDAFYRQAESCEATSLFIDLASVTKVEKTPTTAEFQELMWGWFGRLSDGILEHGGMLDTYVGDAMSSWWTAEGGNNHALAASKCAKHLVNAIADLNETSRSKGWPELQLAIGIASGTVHLGSYGSSRRLRYAPMGDTVNFASRLCSLAGRQYPHQILISETTNRGLAAAFPTSSLGAVNVAGYDKPLQVYAL